MAESPSAAVSCEVQEEVALVKDEELASEELKEEEGAASSASVANSHEVEQDPSVDVLARGIASIMGPVMNNFDAGVEGALKSQSVLASSIDRLTRELDKLLEDVPHPFATQHATRLSGIRRRVLSLNTSLRIIQKRMDMIQRLLPGYVSKTTSRVMEEATFLGTERSHPNDPLLRPLSFSSIEDGDENGDSKAEDNDGGMAGLDGLQDDHTSDESASKEHNFHGERADEDAMDALEPHGSPKASRNHEESGERETLGD